MIWTSLSILKGTHLMNPKLKLKLQSGITKLHLINLDLIQLKSCKIMIQTMNKIKLNKNKNKLI